MKRIFVTMMVVLAVMSQVAPSSARTPYSEATLEGAWGFFEEFRVGDRYGTSIGVVRFDGQGACTIRWITNGGMYAEATESEGECEYTLERSGMGTLTGAGTSDYRLAIAQRGRAVVFIHDEAGTVGQGEMRRMPREAVTPHALAGRWSDIHPAELGGVYETSIGTMEFDGVESCQGKFRVNGGAIQRPRDEQIKCAYEVGPDGFGSVSFGDLFVVTRNHVFMIHSAAFNVGWSRLTRI